MSFHVSQPGLSQENANLSVNPILHRAGCVVCRDRQYSQRGWPQEETELGDESRGELADRIAGELET
jgi:hypothetical protein